MLGQLEALRLVVRADAHAVERRWPRQHLLIDQTADDLAVLEDERHLARAHLQHRAGAAAAGALVAEARIEEAGVVHAEFADQRIERHHLGGVVRRHLHRFLGSEDVELVGIEDQALVGARRDRLPEIGDGVAVALLDVDQAGVALGAIADEVVLAEAREIDADRDAVADIGRGVVGEAFLVVQGAQRCGIEQTVAAAKADLRQPRAFAHQHRKCLRADLGVKRTVVAGVDAIEAPRAVGDHAGEHVDAAGRAFRIGGGGNIGRQRQAFEQRHDVDAVGFQHRAAGQRDLVQAKLGDTLGDGGLRAGQEARADAVGDLAETQIETRGLDLIGREIADGQNPTALCEFSDHMIGQDACGRHHRSLILRRPLHGPRHLVTRQPP